MKRIVTRLLLLMLFFANWAQASAVTNYGIYINNEEITSLNSENFTCPGLQSGKITFKQPSNLKYELTLDNVVLNSVVDPISIPNQGWTYGLISKVRTDFRATNDIGMQIEIKLIGKNVLNVTHGQGIYMNGDNDEITITGGSLVINRADSKNTTKTVIATSGNLNLIDTDITIEGTLMTGFYGYLYKKNLYAQIPTYKPELNIVHSKIDYNSNYRPVDGMFSAVNYTDCRLNNPQFVTFSIYATQVESVGGTTYEYSAYLDQSGNKYEGKFEVEPAEIYPIKVMGKNVNSFNCPDINDDGFMSYDPETNTLTLHHNGYQMLDENQAPFIEYSPTNANETLNIKVAGEMGTTGGKGFTLYTTGNGIVSHGNLRIYADYHYVLTDTWLDLCAGYGHKYDSSYEAYSILMDGDNTTLTVDRMLLDTERTHKHGIVATGSNVKMKVNCAEVRAFTFSRLGTDPAIKGFSELNLVDAAFADADVSYDTNLKATVSNGEIATSAKIERVENGYGIYINGTEITSLNSNANVWNGQNGEVQINFYDDGDKYVLEIDGNFYGTQTESDKGVIYRPEITGYIHKKDYKPLYIRPGKLDITLNDAFWPSAIRIGKNHTTVIEGGEITIHGNGVTSMGAYFEDCDDTWFPSKLILKDTKFTVDRLGSNGTWGIHSKYNSSKSGSTRGAVEIINSTFQTAAGVTPASIISELTLTDCVMRSHPGATLNTSYFLTDRDGNLLTGQSEFLIEPAERYPLYYDGLQINEANKDNIHSYNEAELVTGEAIYIPSTNTLILDNVSYESSNDQWGWISYDGETPLTVEVRGECEYRNTSSGTMPAVNNLNSGGKLIFTDAGSEVDRLDITAPQEGDAILCPAGLQFKNFGYASLKGKHAIMGYLDIPIGLYEADALVQPEFISSNVYLTATGSESAIQNVGGVVLKACKMEGIETWVYNLGVYDTELQPIKNIHIIPSGIAGDVNGDGIIDVSDVVALANYVMGETPEGFNVDVANINGDEIIDVSDVVALANSIMGV